MILSFPITLQLLSLEQNDRAFLRVTVPFKISESKEPGLMDKRFVVFVQGTKGCVSESLFAYPSVITPSNSRLLGIIH